MKTIKKLISCILVFVTLSSVFLMPCYAAVSPTVTPLWDNISNIDASIFFNGNEGSAMGRVVKRSGVTSSEGTVTIYKLVGGTWIYVDSAYKSTVHTLAVSVDFVAESGVQYKAVFEATVYRGDVGESHSITKYKTCP